MRKLIVALLVLAALFVAADRVLASAAEGVVARRAQVAADLEPQPEVQIRGFPFLTQAVRGEYNRIDVSLTALERGDARLKDLVVHLRDVRAPLGQMLRQGGSITVRADSARAAAIVPYQVIEKQLPAGVQAEPNGDRLRLSGNVTVLGQQRSASALVDVSATEAGLAFDPARVQVEGRTVPNALGGRLSFDVQVGDLPFGLRITGVTVRENGLRLTAAGKDLLLTEQGGAASAARP